MEVQNQPFSLVGSSLMLAFDTRDDTRDARGADARDVPVADARDVRRSADCVFFLDMFRNVVDPP